MEKPLVSVLMLTYNHRPYVSNAIDHILNQRALFPFELIIAEDCSTDGTREIVSDYAARYPGIIRLITSGNNVGLQANWNRAHDACIGKYIAYCEGDDYWHRNDKMQLQTEYLERHPECGLVCSDYDVYHLTTQRRIPTFRSARDRAAVQEPTLLDIVSGHGNILTCTVQARRELVTQIRDADPHLHLSGHFKMADTQLWAEVSLLSNIYVMKESLSTRQVLEESATQSTDPRKRLRFWVSAYEMLIYLCDKHRLSPKLRAHHRRNWTRTSLRLAFLEKDGTMAEAAKMKYPDFTLRNRIWYWGAKHASLRLILLLLQRFSGRSY